MELPEPILLRMMKGHTIIFDNALYKVDNFLAEGDERPEENFFIQDGIVCPIVRLETLGDLEKFYRVNRAAEIGEWKETAVREFKVSQHGDEQLKKLNRENMLLEFIVEEVFPYFLEGGDDRLAAMIAKRRGTQSSGDVKAAKAPEEEEEQPNMPPVDMFEKFVEVSDKLSDRKRDLLDSLLGRKREAKQKQKEERRISSALYNDLLGRQDILIADQLVFQLAPIRNPRTGKYSVVLNVDGSNYTLGSMLDYDQQYKNPLSWLKREYMKMLKEVFEDEAINAHPEIERIRTKNKELVKRLEEDDYKKAGLSLIRNNYDSYFICIEVPPYANRDPKTGTLLKFNLVEGKLAPVHVGVKVSLSGKQVKFDRPVVIEPTRHPFLSGESAMGQICLGDYKLPSRYSTKQAVAVLLRKGRITLLSGYKGTLTPHHRLHDTRYFSQNVTDEKEVNKLGLKVTNV